VNVQPFLFGDTWIEVRDGNDSVRSIFNRHYSRYRYADGRKPLLFVGPGSKMVLMTPDAHAVFAWRRFISGDGQTGVNCAIFRNEGAGRSSDLIRAADALADERWPGERHYTYVNPRHTSANPGYCFKQAGWQFCGITKWNKLHILERLP
jgi:hypothetical protein